MLVPQHADNTELSQEIILPLHIISREFLHCNLSVLPWDHPFVHNPKPLCPNFSFSSKLFVALSALRTQIPSGFQASSSACQRQAWVRGEGRRRDCVRRRRAWIGGEEVRQAWIGGVRVRRGEDATWRRELGQSWGKEKGEDAVIEDESGYIL